MPIYTKTGDAGTTGLFRKVGGKSVRVSKSSCNTETLGNIDELNSYIGIIISLTKDKTLQKQLFKVQENLLTIGTIIAGSRLKLRNEETEKLEKEIDIMDRKMPKLTNFIYPGGSVISSYLQYSRTITRRAERSIVGLSEKEKVDSSILKYVNRLSDYLFVLARWENFRLGKKEIKWEG